MVRRQSQNPSFAHHNVYFYTSGNASTLQCSCLENSRDRGAWWAAVHGVAKSWTRLSPNMDRTPLFPPAPSPCGLTITLLRPPLSWTSHPRGLLFPLPFLTWWAAGMSRRAACLFRGLMGVWQKELEVTQCWKAAGPSERPGRREVGSV